MSEQRKRPKAIFERNVKSCTVEIVAQRAATNFETGKPLNIFFHMVGKFEIDSNKRFLGWSLTKITKAYRFSWMNDFSIKTVVFLHDGQQTLPLDIGSEPQFGVNFELSEPKKITTTEAQAFIDAGAKILELDPNEDRIAGGEGLPLAKFKSR